jgi:hypothetical protein
MEFNLDIFNNNFVDNDVLSELNNGFNLDDNLDNNYQTGSYISKTTKTNNTDTTVIPISNICFPSNTPIFTDQGIIYIDKINPKYNTINNKKIIAVTKTTTQDDYLICFERNSLGYNLPCNKTIMTKNHKINYKGKLIEAQHFLKYFTNIHKVKYTGEILYNILMDNYDKILINNLICETLNPNNIIAKLYKKYNNEQNRSKIISTINNCIIKNDYTTYKKILNYL